MLPLCSLLPALLVSVAARADEMTYEEALQRALDANSELLKSEAGQRSAEGALLAARSTFEPTLTASGGWFSSINQSTGELGRVDSTVNSLDWEAGLSQYLSTGTTLSLTTSGGRSRYAYDFPDLDDATKEALGFNDEEDPEVATDLQLGVTQNLLQGFGTSYNLQGVRTAQRTLKTTELAAEATRQQVLADTANAYWSLYQAHKLTTIAEQALEVAREEERIVNAKVEAGDLAPVERTRVAATIVQARSTLLEARNNEAAAAEALQLMIGAPPDGAVTAVTAPAEPKPIDLDTSAIMAETLANNPDLRALRVAEEGAELDLRDARHARLPELSAIASGRLRGNETTLGASYNELFSGKLRDWYVGTELSVPLGNRSDRGSFAQAQASLAQARLDREAFERTLTQLVYTQVRNVEQASLRLELAQANLALAEQTLDAERALQDAGRALQKDVLEAIRAVDDARVAVEQARSNHALAVVELMRLRGAL